MAKSKGLKKGTNPYKSDGNYFNADINETVKGLKIKKQKHGKMKVKY